MADGIVQPPGNSRIDADEVAAFQNLQISIENKLECLTGLKPVNPGFTNQRRDPFG